MKLTIKDLKQQKFTVEAEPSELISDLKAKIAEQKGWEATQQKLIYSGKILQDANTIESYKIEEKGFLVCMLQKPKAAPAVAASTVAEPATPAPAVSATPAAPAAPTHSTTAASAPPATPTPAGSGAAGTPSMSDPATLTISQERAETIANLENMGFERSQIERALRAAFFNPDRAVEYLLNGIPDNLLQDQAAAPAAPAQPAAPAASATTSTGDEGVNLFEAAAAQADTRASSRSLQGLEGESPLDPPPQGLGNLDFLRTNPQFQQLRQVVQQQPQMLEPILQQVGAGNPQLAHLIGQYPEQFLQLLGEDGDDDAPLPPGAQTISVTPEERDAIERLCSLGFPRDQAIQAYFACDKNEELAANFLFEQPDDDEPTN